jgi:DNA-directed RNA polymerase specialized sigma24 family protein
MDRPAPTPDELVRHARFIRTLARQLLRGDEGGEDVVQETYLAALRRPPQESHSLRPWLSRVARNIVYRQHRADTARRRRETLQLVVTAVRGLDEPYRRTVIQHYYEGLPYHRIARRERISVETVRSRLKRARSQIRAQLDRSCGGHRRHWVTGLATLAGLAAPSSASPSLLVLGGVMMKTKIAIAAGLVVIALLGLWWVARPDPDGTARAVRPAAQSVDGDAASGAGDDQATLAAVPKEPRGFSVSGVVKDESDAPVAGVVLFIGAKADPFGLEKPSRLQPGDLLGRVLETDVDGRFSAHWALGDGRVFVRLSPVQKVEPVGESARWIQAPVDDLEFRCKRRPIAVVVVRVNNLSERRPIEGFECSFHTRVHNQRAGTDGEVLEHEVVLPENSRDEQVDLVVALSKPLKAVEGIKRLRVLAGERHEVSFGVRVGGGSIRGRVVDPEGQPLAGALVFLGNQIRARGDEPFKPFRRERVKDAVETKDEGLFELVGEGEQVTVWHPHHTSTTVPIDQSGEVVLPARGGIRGRIVDAEGGPLDGVEVTLDRSTRVNTDAEGGFVFEGVEAGVRGLFLPGKRMFAVRVVPGKSTDVVLRPGLPSVEVNVVRAGQVYAEELNGALYFSGELSPLYTVRAEGGRFTLSDAWPGPYTLLSWQGVIGTVDIRGDRAQLVIGNSRLVVRAPPKTAVWIAPEGSGYFGRLMAARVCWKSTGETGEAVFDAIPDGRYEVGIGQRDLRPRTTVEVRGEAKLDLR